MENQESMGGKIFIGALCGWAGAFVLLCIIYGDFPESISSAKVGLFLSLAPGAIIGIIVTYIANKSSDSRPTVINQETREDRLIKLKELLDQGILTKEEFEEQKKKILQE